MMRHTTITILAYFALGWFLLATADAPATDTLTPEQRDVLQELLQIEETISRQSPHLESFDPEDVDRMAEVAEKEQGDEEVIVRPAKIAGTFIQFNRENAALSADEWREKLALIQAAGINQVIIQWSAENGLAYFEPAPENFTETYPSLNYIFRAAEDKGMQVITGLTYDPHYWDRVPARNDILDVYFRVRNTQNLRLQEALLDVFDGHSSWTGYYISEEIDDINWRQPGRSDLMRQFLLRSGRIVRERDDIRDLYISAFFRKRTAPATFAHNMWNLTYDTGINSLWVQDGIGVEFLGTPLIKPYYTSLQETFANSPPDVTIVVELFEQVSTDDEAFAAEPALPGRVRNQLMNASLLQRDLLVFSILDYADPRGGSRQEELYKLIQEWNLAATQAEENMEKVETVEEESTGINYQEPHAQDAP